MVWVPSTVRNKDLGKKSQSFLRTQFGRLKEMHGEHQALRPDSYQYYLIYFFLGVTQRSGKPGRIWVTCVLELSCDGISAPAQACQPDCISQHPSQLGIAMWPHSNQGVVNTHYPPLSFGENCCLGLFLFHFLESGPSLDSALMVQKSADLFWVLIWENHATS